MRTSTRAYTVDELRQHAWELIQAFKIRTGQASHVDKSYSIPNQRVVMIVPITGEVEYAVLLHELGHILAPTGFLRQGMKVTDTVTLPVLRLIVEEEWSAWEWAKHYALDWTPTMEHVCSITLGGYEEELQNRIALERLGELIARFEGQKTTSPAPVSRSTESVSDFLRRLK